MPSSLKEHWNKMYTNNSISEVGWYETEPFPSVQIIERCSIPMHEPIVDIGSGASTLIARLPV